MFIADEKLVVNMDLAEMMMVDFRLDGCIRKDGICYTIRCCFASSEESEESNAVQIGRFATEEMAAKKLNDILEAYENGVKVYRVL